MKNEMPAVGRIRARCLGVLDFFAGHRGHRRFSVEKNLQRRPILSDSRGKRVGASRRSSAPLPGRYSPSFRHGRRGAGCPSPDWTPSEGSSIIPLQTTEQPHCRPDCPGQRPLGATRCPCSLQKTRGPDHDGPAVSREGSTWPRTVSNTYTTTGPVERWGRNASARPGPGTIEARLSGVNHAVVASLGVRHRISVVAVWSIAPLTQF